MEPRVPDPMLLQAAWILSAVLASAWACWAVIKKLPIKIDATVKERIEERINFFYLFLVSVTMVVIAFTVPLIVFENTFSRVIGTALMGLWLIVLMFIPPLVKGRHTTHSS